MEFSARYNELRASYQRQFGTIHPGLAEWPIELQIPCLELAIGGYPIEMNAQELANRQCVTDELLAICSRLVSES